MALEVLVRGRSMSRFSLSPIVSAFVLLAYRLNHHLGLRSVRLVPHFFGNGRHYMSLSSCLD